MSTSPVDRQDWVRLHPADDVVVLRRALPKGARLNVDGCRIELGAAVAAGHKVAVGSVPERGRVRKYGQTIGRARRAIHPGDWVHTHNLEAGSVVPGTEVGGAVAPWSTLEGPQVPTFQGYARAGGGVGTRNYLGILTTVNCSASAARYVRDRFPDERVREHYPNVDGVVAFTFKGGCGMARGEPEEVLRRVMRGLMRHPNFGALVLLGLGCEVNQLQALGAPNRSDQGTGSRLVSLEIQAQGGLRKTVEAASREVERLLPQVNACRRTPHPVSDLKLALNCGGSDAHSGLTANPALGWASDELVRCGGTSVLGETPEIFGADHLLTRRAVRPDVAEKLQARLRWWADHVRRQGALIDNNPSPGNKAGGITTILEKSLGAVAKGGQAPLMEVYEYAEPIQSRGFCFMDTPGLDPVSMTGLVSGGCTLGVFTTGRGSVYGCKPSPCLKVASHTRLFEWMSDDMDLNAGTILDGEESLEQVGRRIFETMVAVASGRRTQSELEGVGDEEFAPWLLGPTL